MILHPIKTIKFVGVLALGMFIVVSFFVVMFALA